MIFDLKEVEDENDRLFVKLLQAKSAIDYLRRLHGEDLSSVYIHDTDNVNNEISNFAGTSPKVGEVLGSYYLKALIQPDIEELPAEELLALKSKMIEQRTAKSKELEIILEARKQNWRNYRSAWAHRTVAILEHELAYLNNELDFIDSLESGEADNDVRRDYYQLRKVILDL